MTLYITPPDMNDSLSSITLNRKEYLIRFTYTAIEDYWTFGIYDLEEIPVVCGIKIVPRFPLAYPIQNCRLPAGEFGVLTELDHVGRNAFKEGKATFVFIPQEDLEE